MQYAMLDEAQTGIEIAGRNIYNLRYANITILITETPLWTKLVEVMEFQLSYFKS